MLDLNELLRYTVEQRGSDLHIKVGSTPYVRIDGHLTPAPFPFVTPADTERMAFSILPKDRADPLTDLGLSAGDFADLTERVAGLVPAGRRLAFLEGGYDLQALAASAGACVAALAGSSYRPERSTAGGPGRSTVEAVRLQRERVQPNT